MISNMGIQLFSDTTNRCKAKVEEIVKDLHLFSQQINNDELSNVVNDIRQRIQDPFMFVICGEVKAGKSSFVNALLETDLDICRVAPQPMTDTIQQIVYGEQHEEIEINPHLKRITYPVDILKEIAVVDTPGTNTIVAHHQEITERFVPVSDLIVFVFEAKNPYRESNWQFFDLIHKDWKKKTIFVLQQKDLVEEDDLEVNRKAVGEHAEKKGVENPQVFTVSAKLEKNGDIENSGFLPLRNYIANHITGGKAPMLKLENSLLNAETILDKISDGLTLRQAQLDKDLLFRQELKECLDKEYEKSIFKVNNLIEHLLSDYDNVSNHTSARLRSGLAIGPLLKRSFSAIFNKESSSQKWFESLNKELVSSLESKLNDTMTKGIQDIAQSIETMTLQVGNKLETSDTILKNDHEIFKEIAAKRSQILDEMERAFRDFMEQPDSYYDKNTLPKDSNIGSNLATGSGMAVIGMVLTAVTNVSVMDITGGILTGLGVLFASITVGWNKRRILQSHEAEIAKGRFKLSNDLQQNLTAYVSEIQSRLVQIFKKFDKYLKGEEENLLKLNQTKKNLNESVSIQKKEIEQVLRAD